MMTRNHLPGGGDLGALSAGGFAETTFDGVGFGLGFAVRAWTRCRPRRSTRVGEYYWGGAASTAFWVDPVEEITARVHDPAAASSSATRSAPQLRQLVYSALVD